MKTQLAITQNERAVKTWHRLESDLLELKKNSRAANTIKAYQTDFKHFAEWCESNGFSSMPARPEAVALYMADIKDSHKLSTIERRLVSIRIIHKQFGEADPTRVEDITDIQKGLRREKTRAQREATPLLSQHLKRMCHQTTESPIDTRDRALLLIGFAGGLRRSSLAGLDVEDIKLVDEGLIITLRKSKTDQEGQGRNIGISYGSNPVSCPVRSYNKWLAVSGIESGPVFRSIDRHGNIKENRIDGKTVSRIIKKRTEEIGLDPSCYSGHSLRAGLVTQAAMNGVNTLSIMDQTGHKSERMVKKYYRNATLFKNNASSSLGL